MDIASICRDNGRVVELSSMGRDFTRQAIVTCNERMLERLALLESVAATDLSMMIVGEPGVEKQRYAEYIHRLSARAAAPYVRFDCVATRESQYEERLFGAQSGGVVRRGVLESAQGGTVLLDSAASIPEAFYSRLERLLDERTVVRRGGREKVAVDVRLLSTCSRDLVEVLRREAELGRLLQQMAAVRIDVLPLRRRREDIALLTLHYLEQANERFGMEKRMGSALFRRILEYDWLGNERELRSFVEQMALVSGGEVLDDLTLMRSATNLTAAQVPAWKERDAAVEKEERSLKEQVAEYELMIIRQSISKYGSLRKAARALKTDPSVLSRKLSAAREP